MWKQENLLVGEWEVGLEMCPVEFGRRTSLYVGKKFGSFVYFMAPCYANIMQDRVKSRGDCLRWIA
jgi:hypothetical protein